MSMTNKNEKTGLPLIDQETKEKKMKFVPLGQFIVPIITTAIGYGIAYAVYAWGDRAKFDANLRTVKS